MHYEMENSAMLTGKEKTRFKETKEEAFLKTSTHCVGVLYLVLSCNGVDKPAQAA